MSVAVYHHRDGDGTVLYVGVSLCPTCRMKGHVVTSDWAKTISSIDVHWFDTRQEALDFERKEIVRLRPRFNVIFANHKRQRATQQNGHILTKWMDDHGFSAADFAMAGGISVPTVDGIAASERNANWRTQLAIIRVTQGELDGGLFGFPRNAVCGGA